jgi:hypothetical protein
MAGRKGSGPQRAEKRAGQQQRKRAVAEKKKAAKVDAGPSEAAPLLVPKPRDMKHHISAIQVAKARLDKEQASYRNVCKAADEAGIDVKAVRNAITMHSKPALNSQSYFTQLSLALQELGAPVQINVHQAKFEDAVAEAKVRGYADGTGGNPQSHSWVKGSPAARAYDDAYADGQMENVDMSEEERSRIRAERAESRGESAAAH